MFFKKHSQIQNIYMVQYEKRLKRKMQSIIYESNRRGILNEVFLEQCELKRKKTEGKLNDLRAKLALLLQKLQLVSGGCGVGMAGVSVWVSLQCA